MSVTRETLRQLVDIVDNKDINLIYQVLVRFIPEAVPLPDETAAIKAADDSINQYGTIDYVDINWD